MNQHERRLYLIRALLDEYPQYSNIKIPDDAQNQNWLLRSLLNIRMPSPIGDDFLSVQDAYLRDIIAEKGVTNLTDLQPVQPDLYLWQGDITLLRCDAIVNAANSGMTGCYQPCHACIDNCIHTYAGVQLRLECAEIMQRQDYEEPAGMAKITKAYNLPCKYVLHTVGPTVGDCVTAEDELLLASCYRSCLELAEQNNVKTIAFCCISTGIFHFPSERAAEIAVQTVKKYKFQTNSEIKVIFNVFKDRDDEIYRALLGAD
jgi:O-acetyl-ADP-ribose deacetylase (regulator of RNase III)